LNQDYDNEDKILESKIRGKVINNAKKYIIGELISDINS
jgi:hypothetical protein